MTYLSYLMGADQITDQDLQNLNIEIADRAESGSRMLKIPDNNISAYKELIKEKLNNGFWNEMIGENNISFIFKFKDGTTKEIALSPETESEIDKLCAEFNNETPDKTANVYKYLSENEFYHDFMHQHYSDMINRP